MTLYEKGDKVIRVSSKDKGIIVAIGPCGRGGRQLYKVSFGGIESDELEGNLMADYDMNDPFERCRNNIYGSFIEFSKVNTTFKIQNSNISTVSSLKASKTLFKAYQFKPLLKFLNSDNKRILVADEVGLGKTIEAGHIMLEQKARNEFHNALVICPSSLREKWKEELKDKFGLTFTIIDSAKELIQMIEDHDGLVRAIINYEKVRSRLNSKTNEEKNSILKYLSERGKKFSFILCDEAHKLRNDDTKTYKGVEQIMECADAAVFLTATPIMISSRNLYNLLHLLDNQRYSNPAIFEQGLRENAPFLAALSELTTNKPLPQIAQNLCDKEIDIVQEVNERIYRDTHLVKDHFAEFPLFQRIIERMNNEEDTLTLRAQLQHDIMSMSQMNQVFSRTRKREVTTDWSQAERHPYPCIIPLNEDERDKFDEVINDYIDDNSYTDDWGEQRLTQGGSFGLVGKKRQIASSVYAYLSDNHNLIKGVDVYADYPDAKVDYLVNKIISEVFKNGTKKLIVFAIFTKTIYYLSIRLKKAGYNCVMIHGKTDKEDRYDIIEQFKNDDNIHILLSSEVGSEGLDMQFCNTMVNYDLPWNPMVVEQRIGRIDRFGQQSPIVHIYNMVVKDSIQEDIYVRLLNRIGIFHESLGEMEAILDPEIEKSSAHKVTSFQELYSSMEKEFFCTNLSREERQRKIDEIARAYIHEKEELKHLEKGLTNSLTNDAYFRNEINRILNNNAYVTEFELKSYLEMLLKEHLTTCQLETVGDGVFEIVLPKSNLKVLRNFLMTYQPKGDENILLFKQFCNSIQDLQRIKITFDQEVAYANRKVVFINLYNPIIQAALVYFKGQANIQERTFRFDVSQRNLNMNIKAGTYYLAIYQIETIKSVFGSLRQTNTLYPILYDIAKDCIVDDRDLTSEFFGKIQKEGVYQRADISSQIERQLIDNMEVDLACQIAEYKEQYEKEIKLQSENSSLMLRQQTAAYYKYRIESMKQSLKKAEENLYFAQIDGNKKDVSNAEGAIRLHSYNLRTLERDMEDELNRVSQTQDPIVNSVLLSINFINVV